jgi:hypothetical protein
VKSSVQNYISNLNPSNFTNKTQRLLYNLLQASIRGEDWVTISAISATNVYTRHATTRICGLRLKLNGGFSITCKSALQLALPGDHRTFYYKIDQNITLNQLLVVFLAEYRYWTLLWSKENPECFIQHSLGCNCNYYINRKRFAIEQKRFEIISRELEKLIFQM